MKIIKYKIANQSASQKVYSDINLKNVEISCEECDLESCIKIVKKEAYNGEYTIEDDNAIPTPTQLDRIEAQVTYTAMMTNTLMEG